MRRIGHIFVGMNLLVGTAALFAQPPAETDPPKAEKNKSDKGKGKQKGEKRKAEEPKAGKHK